MMDYDFIERLLQTMTKEKTFCVDVMHLNEELGKSFPDTTIDDFNNKFYESLFLLKDCGVIEEMAGSGLGFKTDTAGNIRCWESIIRLTAGGHNFYDNLRKTGFLSKTKSLSLTASVELSKALITKSIDKLLDSF